VGYIVSGFVERRVLVEGNYCTTLQFRVNSGNLILLVKTQRLKLDS